MSTTKQQVQTYYYFDEDTRTIYTSTELLEFRPDLIMLGSSLNPNHKMTAAVLAKDFGITHSLKIQPL